MCNRCSKYKPFSFHLFIFYIEKNISKMLTNFDHMEMMIIRGNEETFAQPNVCYVNILQGSSRTMAVL